MMNHRSVTNIEQQQNEHQQINRNKQQQIVMISELLTNILVSLGSGLT